MPAGWVDGDLPDHLAEAEGEALDALASTPCSSDAEFIEKLRYLHDQQAKLWGPVANGDDPPYGCLAIASECHFRPAFTSKKPGTGVS